MKLWLVGPTGTAPIPLDGMRMVTHSPGEHDEDAVDIAIWELDDRTILGLGECTFLSQLDIAADDDCGEDYYFFTGFPVVWARTGSEDRGLTLMTYCTQLYKGSTSGFLNYRPGWHVVLNRMGGLKITGERTDMPDHLKGISGCSVWRSNFTRNAQLGGARVVAVQTGAFNDDHSVVKATRWPAVVAALLEFDPSLKQAMSLTLPR